MTPEAANDSRWSSVSTPSHTTGASNTEAMETMASMMAHGWRRSPPLMARISDSRSSRERSILSTSNGTRSSWPRLE